MEELKRRADAVRARLLELVDLDAEAFQSYMEANRRVKAGKPGSEEILSEASLRVATVPLESARAALEAMELAREVSVHGNPVARTDAQVAIVAAHAAVLGSVLNVRGNLPLLKPDQRPEDLQIELAHLEQRAALLLQETLPPARG